MLLWIENSTFAVNIYTSIRSLPFPIDETNDNFRFTLMASELNRFNKDFYRAYSKNGAPYANVFVDQMRFNHTH
jgi:hypothetical protein